MKLQGTLRLSDHTGRRTVGKFSNLINDNAAVFRRYFGVDLFPGSLNVDVPSPPSLQHDLDAGIPVPSITIPKSELINMPAYVGDGQAWACTLSGSKFQQPVRCWIFRRKGSRVPHGVIEKVLRHAKYQGCGEASKVNADAQHLASRLARFSDVEGASLGISFGPVQHVDTDGSTSKHIFVQLTSVLSVACTGTVTIIRDPAVSEEEHVRLAAEAAARAAEFRRQTMVRRGQAAMKDARVLDLMELVKVEKLSPTQMGHIVDLVRDLCAGKLDTFAGGSEIKRFERSINHPGVMGLDSRHAVTSHQPPPKPMTLGEAGEFARRIGAEWLARLDAT